MPGRSGVSAHFLRHTFATPYLERCPDKLQKVSEYLGHADVGTTTRFYIHARMTPAEVVGVVSF
jgi:integrase